MLSILPCTYIITYNTMQYSSIQTMQETLRKCAQLLICARQKSPDIKNNLTLFLWKLFRDFAKVTKDGPGFKNVILLNSVHKS